MQISAASLSLKFYSGTNYVKNNSVSFLAICVNFPCKIETFELEVVVLGIFRTGFCFQGSQLHIYQGNHN